MATITALPQPQPIRPNVFVQTWLRLTAPHPSITDIEQRRQSRLLASLLAALTPLIILSLILNIANKEPVPILVLTPTIMGVVIVAFFVNRAGHYALSATITVVVTIVLISVGSFFSGVLNSQFQWVTIIILAAALLRVRSVILLALAGLVELILFAMRWPGTYPVPTTFGVQLFVLAGGAMVVFILHRNALERERQAELQTANDQLRESERLLEARVAERTRELAAAQQETQRLYNEQVIVAEKLREADEIKSRFLASMSHELRTPLNAILNFTKFVSTGTLGPINDQQVDALDKTIQSGRHLLNLINDVLDVTKIESNMLNLFVEEDIDLQDELKIVADSGDSLLTEKAAEVKLVRDIDANLPQIIGDRRRIRQILLNLVSNACKFTERGTVTVSAHVQGDEVLMLVQDTGPGISAEDQAIIFEPFRQARHGVSHGGGTGLGLAIARRLAEAHGGELWLESTVGAGSTFYVKLPIHSEALRSQIPAKAGA